MADVDPRTAALAIARARVVVGLSLFALPGLAARTLTSERSASANAILRMVGIRDIALGIGAITTVKEGTLDAEWVSMGALADAGDAIAALFIPAPPLRRMRNIAVAASSAVVGLALARHLADERRVLPDAES
jgi:uncharacterized protein YjeT (DUF2065 family)